jgi:hypothetical protein
VRRVPAPERLTPEQEAEELAAFGTPAALAIEAGDVLPPVDA